jgi:hypothetical protein
MKTRLPNSWAQPVNQAGIWTLSAGIVWTLALAGLVVRFSCGGAHRAYAFNDYTLAGLHWMRGECLYGNWRGFIYSPVTAAFFAPFSCLPPALAYSLWPSRCRNVDLCYRSSTLRLAPTPCPSASSCCSLFVPALVLRFGPVSCLD